MIKDPENIALSAQKALTLEVAATPKPGSVDRFHYFSDTKFEHFLVSAISIGPVIYKAALGEYGVGKTILKGVLESKNSHSGGNTHLGTLTLISPLCLAASSDKTNFENIFKEAKLLVEKAGVKDSKQFLEAVRKSGAGGLGSREELDASRKETEKEIVNRSICFKELMEITERDDVAKELIEGYPKVKKALKNLQRFLKNNDFNKAAVKTFITISAEGDTFILRKFGEKTYIEVKKKFGEIVASGFEWRLVEELDKELNKKGINPGSSADILGAAIFLNLLEGWSP